MHFKTSMCLHNHYKCNLWFSISALSYHEEVLRRYVQFPRDGADRRTEQRRSDMVRKAKEIPIICFRPRRRMFKLKSQTPVSLSPLLSVIAWRFMWRWGFQPPLPSSPVTPCSLCVSVQQAPPQGLTSSPKSKKRKKKTHIHVHVLLLGPLQVLSHKHGR